MAGLRIYSPCGGQGHCGKCVVFVTSGVDEPSHIEERCLGRDELARGCRLACQARLVGDTEVVIPASSLVEEHRIVVEGASREVSLEPNIHKTALRLAAPSADDARPDLARVLDGLGGKVGPPSGVIPLAALPGLLRASGYQVTAVVAGDRLLTCEPGDTSEQAYGAAIDVGTTTVVLYLVDLLGGEVVATASGLNAQSRYGGDVISRLKLAVTEAGGTERLADAVRDVINDLVGRASRDSGVPREAIYEVAVVGNACMTHLFLGIPPSGLAGVPFVPAVRTSQSVRAADVGIEVNGEAVVFVAPNIGGFVGSDSVGVMLASEFDRADGLQVAVDIGTNGEILVARNGELCACSTAAGPAFEGARISRGMRAAAGAIDAVRIGDDVECRIIGGGPARGICGSGLVDAVAELVRVGVVSDTGRLRPPDLDDSVPEGVRRRLIETEDGTEFILAWGDMTADSKPLSITARDIREAQLAKAAIHAGIESLLERFDATPDDIERLVLAGAFGNYISRSSAAAIGLIPEVDLARVESIGNAAGVGARLVLSSMSERRRADEIARRTEHVDLSQTPGFYDRFADSMMLAHRSSPA
jgi:uncharacterized 2Fe-2S/4Fe-4S cluster protein (DUF4445 family)